MSGAPDCVLSPLRFPFHALSGELKVCFFISTSSKRNFEGRIQELRDSRLSGKADRAAEAVTASPPSFFPLPTPVPSTGLVAAVSELGAVAKLSRTLAPDRKISIGAAEILQALMAADAA